MAAASCSLVHTFISTGSSAAFGATNSLSPSASHSAMSASRSSSVTGWMSSSVLTANLERAESSAARIAFWLARTFAACAPHASESTTARARMSAVTWPLLVQFSLCRARNEEVV
eukprot:3621768-Prymnesium_polylepis.1